MAAVCVFCASSRRSPQRYVDLAAEVGGLLAARGHTLVSGGASIGLMSAVAAAVRTGGGRTVGVIPRALLDLEVADHDSDELQVVADMRTRKGQMDARSDAFLTLPGGIGTLEELLEVWVARSLGLHSKPVVVLDPDGVYDGLRAQVEHLLLLGLVREQAVHDLQWALSAHEALALVESGLGVPGAPAAALSPPEDVPPPEEVLEAGDAG